MPEGTVRGEYFDPQMKQCQQDTHCFLLIPGEHHGKRQIVDTAVKCFCQCHRNLDGAVSIVALSHIHYSRKTANRTQIQIIEPVFAAGKGQNNAVCRCLLYKFGIIIASRLGTVTSADQKEMFDAPDLTASMTVSATERTAWWENPVMTVLPPFMPVKCISSG